MIRLTAVIDIEGQLPRAVTYESSAQTIVLGRDATADFQLPLATVSRHHARICELDGVYTIEDMGSTHGVIVNDKLLVPHEKKVLRHGDMIELTKAKITCSIESKQAVDESAHGTQAIAARAVQDILGRLGEARSEGPFLRVLNGQDEGVRFSLIGVQAEWTIGRSKDCECLVHDSNISRRHAVIKKDWNGFFLQDLGSKNGVMVNDKPIQKQHRLQNQDEILIGPVKIVFSDPDADLLSALKGVPGFDVEDPIAKAEEANNQALQHASQVAEQPKQLHANVSFSDYDEPTSADDAPTSADDMALDVNFAEPAIDPALLTKPKLSGISDWLVLGVIGVMAIVCFALLYAFLT